MLELIVARYDCSIFDTDNVGNTLHEVVELFQARVWG